VPDYQPEVESEVQRQADRLDETQVQGAGTKPASGSSRDCLDDGTRAQRSGRPRWIEETESSKKRPCRAATYANCQTDLLCAAMTMAGALSRQERYCRRPDLHAYAYAYAFAFAALCSAMLLPAETPTSDDTQRLHLQIRGNTCSLRSTHARVLDVHALNAHPR
jgi:hypothetical protein